jgi:hypothetical protein
MSKKPIRVPSRMGVSKAKGLRFTRKGNGVGELTVEAIGASGKPWAMYRNDIYGLLPGHDAHLQLVDRKPGVNVTVGLPFDLLVHIAKG